MSHNLQQQGPPVLRDLAETDLLHLVDLLISDKKLVEECLSEKYPFKLIQPADKGSSKGLSSIFLDTQSQPGLQSWQKQKQKEFQNLPPAGDLSPTIHKNLNKSRNEIVADCRKLLELIVTEYQQGFSIGRFRKMFLEKYGYPLEVHKFNYNKLVSLIQTMPGVKIEAGKIMPAPFDIDLKSYDMEAADPSVQKVDVGDAKSNSGANMSATPKMSNLPDSSWEELGPITCTTPKRQKVGSSRKKKREAVEQVNYDYEPASDVYLSGSDDENLSSRGDGRHYYTKKGEDSSLLQILDWYQNKEDDTRSSKDCTKAVPDKVDVLDSCSGKDSISLSSGSLKNKDYVGGCEKKLRPSKSYSFVSDEVVDDKDKLIDGILGSLKKSGGRSAESGI